MSFVSNIEEEKDTPCKGKDTEKNSFTYIYIVSTFVIIFSILFRFFSPVQVVQVNGQSMNPTLNDGQIMTMDKINANHLPNRMDVVIADKAGEKLIKRVIGLPGDEILVKTNGTVYINGEELTELNKYQIQVNSNPTPEISLTIPDNHYFLMGDNFNNSCDSRYFGAVDITEIKGIIRT